MRIISVIGLGVAENAVLSDCALMALESAELVIGSIRQLLTISPYLLNQKTAVLPKLSALKSLIETHNKVVILGSGDPLYYGIGRWLTQQFSAQSLQFFPAVSSITQACHQLHIAQQDIDVVSLHGRPLTKLKVHLKAEKILLILTDKQSQPIHLARLCLETGFSDAKIVVCESLGYDAEKISHFTVDELLHGDQDFDPLHVCFIFCQQNKGYLPEFAGIKDRYFETGKLGSKGLISKREVRLAVLSLLQLKKNDRVWDIGAGCGAISVELAYWQQNANIVAIEHHATRFECLVKNSEKFGVVSNLSPVFGRAPEILSTLKPANKIFIGGSDGELASLLDLLWENLPVNGQIVASAVLENTKSQLLGFYQARLSAEDAEAETLQIAINKGEMLAEQLVYRPALPVNLFSFIKKEIK